MRWVLLAVGAGIELLASASLKLSGGFAKIGYAGLKLMRFAVAFCVMSLKVRTMPLGIACTVWAGGGIAGVTLRGAVVFGQTLDGHPYLGLGLILAGVIVLNALTTAASG